MDDIINYTMENPGNTNPNVLRGLLENYSEGGGSGNSDLMILKITNADTPGEYTFSHTPAEVSIWLQENKPAIVVMHGQIGKVYIDADNDVCCAFPCYTFWGGENTGMVFDGDRSGDTWVYNSTRQIIGADETLSTGRGERAIIWDAFDGRPYYQPINDPYELDGALNQLFVGAIQQANPEAAVSTVFDQTATEFESIANLVSRINGTFGDHYRGVMLCGLVDNSNRDAWLVKNVYQSDHKIIITADNCDTVFTSTESTGEVRMISVIITLELDDSIPSRCIVTAICKKITSTII